MMSWFFLKLFLMTITQHALLYNFHTSNLIFEEIFFLKFLSMQPLLTSQMDLSPCTRVYIRGGQWASHLFRFWPVQSGTILQIPIKRSLDLFRLMWWLSYVGYRYDMWRVSHLLGSDVSLNLWKDLEDPGGACLSPSYTSNKRFTKICLLAILKLPWHMTSLRSDWNVARLRSCSGVWLVVGYSSWRLRPKSFMEFADSTDGFIPIMLMIPSKDMA